MKHEEKKNEKRKKKETYIIYIRAHATRVRETHKEKKEGIHLPGGLQPPPYASVNPPIHGD